MRLGEESYPVMEWQKGWICEVSIPSPHPMSRIVSEDWGESQAWIVVVSCGTKDAEVEYASAVQWSSGGFLGGIDIFSFFLSFLVWDGVIFVPVPNFLMVVGAGGGGGANF